MDSSSLSLSSFVEPVPKDMSASWLVSEILKHSDVSVPLRIHHDRNDNYDNDNDVAAVRNGDICLFHYPMTFCPKVTPNKMKRAFEFITWIENHHDHDDENILHDDNVLLRKLGEIDKHSIEADDLRTGCDTHAENAQVQSHQQAASSKIKNIHEHPISMTLRQYVHNATLRARDEVTRIHFSWYQFDSFPNEIVGRTYRNLRHVDIRHNATLTCIDSIVQQLPHLSSLNLSDCPNLCTLLPLACRNIQHYEDDSEHHRSLNLRHLWVRGCNLFSMSNEEWGKVFDSLSKSTGPIERLTLSRNRMRYLHEGIGKLKSLTYLFVEDNYSCDGNIVDHSRRKFEVPMSLGALTNLRFVSLNGNNIFRLPQTMGRLHTDCDIHLGRNPNLIYPPAPHRKSVKAMREFFHRERMTLLCGVVLLLPHVKRAKLRANERLYRPGGLGYWVSKDRFEDTVKRCSIPLLAE